MKTQINYLLSLAILSSIGISFSAVAAEKPIPNEANITTQIAQNTTPTKQKGEGKKDKLMEKLNLTSQQKQQMESIRSKYQPQINSLREQMRTEREKMSTMMRNNESENSLRAQHQSITALNQKMQNLRFESMLEMQEVLTPEQRQQFSQMMGERRANDRGTQK
ncbi:hypothetical protein GM3708_2724 [Geminocystis sp. NIES-3708]|uniref:Spy/CpxP family protein refolding chaperone n=1 Tax=Geminocystis sp. NIES-3708 TaxID=1615909 RepID=UPI0005FC4824|nr:Spy/CpxP family protein refolding chaperone [Geminocystis sp. NIES-3708]BAQ62318.1 hypothetical protein GM3708_2724 [Geminocystis sp. NIES-3708]